MKSALFMGASLGLIAGAAHAADPSSNKWIDQRNQLFADVCIGSAPTFKTFESKAARAGFHKDGNNWIFRNPEIVVSLGREGRHCTCFLSYGTDDPKKAVQRLSDKLALKYGEKMRPTANEKTYADIETDDLTVTLMINVLDREKDGKWLGLHLISPVTCPVT